jgi:hypothetical protein
MFRHLAFAAATCGVLASPALAQDSGPAGLAVAQAAEAGLGVCFGLDAAGTMECAQSECMMQSGLGAEHCAVNLWCYPHGWTAQVAVMHVEGIHWTKFICYELSREGIDAAVAAHCANDMFMECFAVQIWDHDGNKQLAEN